MHPRGEAYTESMAYSSRTTVAKLSLRVGLAGVVSLIGVTACGHFGVDLVAAEEGIAADGGGGGGGGDEDGSITADGGSDASIDARDGGALVCDGPNCPGIYVAGTTGVGSDTNPGTSDKPVATIAKGILLAQALGVPTSVYVAATASGKYSDAFVVVEGVSLYGGYECAALPCTWKRDLQNQANNTIIGTTTYRGIVVGDTISRATVIDGFYVFGKGGTPDIGVGAAVITIDGGAPTIRRCRLEAGAVSGGVTGLRRSIGIAVLGPSGTDPAGPLLDNNVVRGGQAVEASIGVLVTKRAAASFTVQTAVTIIGDNNIRSATAESSFGILASNSAPSTYVDGNTISSGISTGGEIGSWGVSIAGGGTFTRNRINIEASPTATSGPICSQAPVCGGFRSESSAAVVTSNLIRGAKAPFATGVLLNIPEGAPGDVHVNGNTIDPVGSGADDTTTAAIVLRNESLVDRQLGKIRNNILIGGTNTLRYGVYEQKWNSGKQVHPIALDNNCFYLSPRVTPPGDYAYHYYDAVEAKDLSLDEMKTILAATASANMNGDPLLDSTFHLKTGSPVIDKGTKTDIGPHDFDGEARVIGANPDIGMDEKQ
jgi:hypothetical protein